MENQKNIFGAEGNRVTWNRYGGYEVSSKGDSTYSALNALMPDGRTIEMHYQCDIKGYQPGGRNWMLGKGKPPKHEMSHETLYAMYLNLWRTWATANSGLMYTLRHRAFEHGNILSDRFASTPINQARALADILNETAAKLMIYTCSIYNSYKVPEHMRFDITVKSAQGDGRAFTPTWEMVKGYQNRSISKDTYTEMYIELMRRSFSVNNGAWRRLLQRDFVVLVCYCHPGEFCHRHILTTILRKGWGASYLGEIERR